MNRLKALGLSIREARLEKGLSQEKLAHEAKMHRNYVGLIERGAKTPTLGIIFALADTLGTSVSVLFARAEVIGAEAESSDDGFAP